MPGPSLFTTDLLMTEVERIDGTIVIDLHTENEYTYHIMIREQGSICLYGTRTGSGLHLVVYDTVDNQEPNEQAKAIFKRLSWTRDAIDLLLAHAGK